MKRYLRVVPRLEAPYLPMTDPPVSAAFLAYPENAVKLFHPHCVESSPPALLSYEIRDFDDPWLEYLELNHHCTCFKITATSGCMIPR
jgi:hypothetical protein